MTALSIDDVLNATFEEEPVIQHKPQRESLPLGGDLWCVESFGVLVHEPSPHESSVRTFFAASQSREKVLILQRGCLRFYVDASSPHLLQGKVNGKSS